MTKSTEPRAIVKDAIIWLLMNEPFWACILMRLKVLMTDNLIPALGTDGVWLICNNSWIKNQPFMEVVAGLVHEACHIALKHNFRRGKRNFIIWNYAGDYAINALIKKKQTSSGGLTGFEIPAKWLYNPNFEGMSAEEIYEKIKNDFPSSCTSGRCVFDPNASSEPGQQRPDNGDIIFDFNAPTEEERRAAEENFDSVIEGIAKSMQAGKLPGFMKFDLDARHKHVIDYRDLLRDWLTKNVFSQDYSWLHADRRFCGSGFHIPSLIDNIDGVPNILLVCDVSGSMLNDHDLSTVASEINGVLEEFPGKYFVLYTDVDFRGIQEVSYEEPLKLRFEGGGGTDFGRIMRHIKESNYDFDAMLFFSDMETNSFGADPGKPVLWMNTAKKLYMQPPFGRVITIAEHRK